MDRVDFASEQYFANFRMRMRMDRAATPDSYDSVEKGLVSSVKNQKQCGEKYKSILTSVASQIFLSKSGSCVAFANMAAIETCFKKKTGVFGEFSESVPRIPINLL